MAQESGLSSTESDFTFCSMVDYDQLMVGYKSTAEFWLDNIFEDGHFKDGSLVVNPCNSPEQLPTTFGCTHYQQLIWELFNAVEKASMFVGETDLTFLSGGSLRVFRSILFIKTFNRGQRKKSKAGSRSSYRRLWTDPR